MTRVLRAIPCFPPSTFESISASIAAGANGLDVLLICDALSMELVEGPRLKRNGDERGGKPP